MCAFWQTILSPICWYAKKNLLVPSTYARNQATFTFHGYRLKVKLEANKITQISEVYVGEHEHLNSLYSKKNYENKEELFDDKQVWHTLDEKMDLQQLQNQCKYEVNTTFDQICFYFPWSKFHCWIIFAREAKMVNTAFTPYLHPKASEKKNCTFSSYLTRTKNMVNR